MHRPGCDPEHLTMSDVLCDFCRSPWDEGRAMVEGHRGSVICGACLTAAYAGLVRGRAPGGALAPPGSAVCTMCLETRDEPGWRSPTYEEALICARCAKQAGAILEKDKESGWTRPA